MRILPRYFVSRFLGLFAAILFGSILVIVIVEMLLNLDDMLKVQEGFAGVAAYLLLRIPSYYLADLLPGAAFAAAFFTFGLAARWQEMVAIQSGGISPGRVVRPVLAAALVLAALTLVLSETWMLRANREWKSQVSGGTGAIDYRRGSFWYQRGHTIYNVRGADRDTRTLVGVALYERNREGRLVRSIQAERVRIAEDGLWRLEDAVIRRFDPDRPGSPVQTRLADRTVLRLGGDGEAALMDADAGLLPLGRLRDYVRERADDGEPAQRLVALMHARITDPLSVFVLALLAVPFGLRVGPSRGFGPPALLAVGALALFFAARAVAGTLGAEGVVHPAWAPWSVAAGTVVLGVWQWSRATR